MKATNGVMASNGVFVTWNDFVEMTYKNGTKVKGTVIDIDEKKIRYYYNENNEYKGIQEYNWDELKDIQHI